MTDKVIPSSKGDSNAYIVAQLLQHGAGTKGWIQESSSALLADNDNDLDQTAVPLNAFDASYSGTSLTVTIDTGEAFVGGAWLGRDVTTNVDLNGSTSNQTVYLGWKHDVQNDILIGLDDGSTGDPGFTAEDKRIPIWTFDTDSSGVTSATDERKIGKTTDLGVVDLDADSTLDRWIGDAVGSTYGTPGNSNNEAFRIGSNASDLVMTVTDGDGKMNLAYNAYFDGTDWRYIQGSEPAMRMTFDSGVKIHTSGSGTADNVITWATYHVDTGGTLSAPTGDNIWDQALGAVPQSSMEGPPSQIGSYPVNTNDIDDGEGSNLDADYLRGQTPSDITGEWTFIEEYEDTDTTTTFDYTFSTTSPYDLYRTNVYFENLSSSENRFLALRLNNDSSSSYYHVHVDLGDRAIYKRTQQTNFHSVAGSEPGNWSYDEHVIGKVSSISNLDNDYPKVSALGPNLRYYQSDGKLIAGELRANYSAVDQFRYYSFDWNAVGKIEVFGQNVR